MSNTVIERDLIKNISDIAWSDCGDAEIILQKIQGFLYEYEQIVDHASLEEEKHYEMFYAEVQKQGQK